MEQQHILVVDDCADVRQIIARLATNAGWRVLEAASGTEGVEIARRHRPSLIVTDLNLPGIDGLEVIRQIRADPALDDVPIIAVTAYAFASATRLVKSAGCQSVIFKPFQVDVLLQEMLLQVQVNLLSRHA